MNTLTYALRNSERQVSEQKNFFPFCVGRMYFNVCRFSAHHVQPSKALFFGGRPRSENFIFISEASI